MKREEKSFPVLNNNKYRAGQLKMEDTSWFYRYQSNLYDNIHT